MTTIALLASLFYYHLAPESGIGDITVSIAKNTSPILLRTAPGTCVADEPQGGSHAFKFISPIDNAWADPGVVKYSLGVEGAADTTRVEAVRYGDKLHIRSFTIGGLTANDCWAVLSEDEKDDLRSALFWL
jgi:hypothetical protein